MENKKINVKKFLGANGVITDIIIYPDDDGEVLEIPSDVKKIQVKHAYPQVKTLVLQGDVFYELLDTQMFPNVSEVKTEGAGSFDKKSKSLLRYDVLVATWCCEDTYRIPKEVKIIGRGALKNTSFSHIECEEKLQDIHTDALTGSAWEKEHVKQGHGVIGNVLLILKQEIDTLEAPSGIESVVPAFRKNGQTDICRIQNLVLQSSSDIALFSPRTGTYDVQKLIVNDMEMDMTLKAFQMKSIGGPKLKVTNENQQKYCTDEDGVLYNKDKSKLLYFPNKLEKDAFFVPDTVQKISAYAFYKCENVKKVVLPDNLAVIEDNAFGGKSCFEEIVFPKSQKTILMSSEAFRDAAISRMVLEPRGEKCHIDREFSRCTIQHLEIKSGMKVIRNGAFKYAYDKEYKPYNCCEVTLPKDVRVYRDSLMGFSKIVLSEDIKDIIVAAAYNHYVLIRTADGKEYLIPPYLRYSFRKSLNLSWNIGRELFDKAYKDALKSMTVTEMKMDYALYCMEHYPCLKEEMERYIRRSSGSYLSTLIKDGKSREAIQFIEMHMCTDNAIKKAIALCEELGDKADVSAYLLREMEPRKKSTFAL